MRQSKRSPLLRRPRPREELRTRGGATGAGPLEAQLGVRPIRLSGVLNQYHGIEIECVVNYEPSNIVAQGRLKWTLEDWFPPFPAAAFAHPAAACIRVRPRMRAARHAPRHVDPAARRPLRRFKAYAARGVTHDHAANARREAALVCESSPVSRHPTGAPMRSRTSIPAPTK